MFGMTATDLATEALRLRPDERPNVDNGDWGTVEPAIILRTEVGSGLHGIAIEGTDDRDEMAIFVEPRRYVTGISVWSYTHNREMHADGHGMPHYTYRTQPDGVRSTPGDLDLSAYSLRNYARLAAKGNPTVLLPLWAPDESVMLITPLGERLRASRRYFLSQHAVHRFLRYMEAQRERMMGLRQQARVPKRPELVEKHGYDTKYAAHALRLSMQGFDLATEHTIYLPMRSTDRELVLSVKRGERSQDWVNEEIRIRAQEVEDLLNDGKTGLPEHPDYDVVNNLLDFIHEKHWNS